MRRSVHNLGLFLCVACVACQMAEQPATELATAEPVSEPVVREESIAAADGVSLVYDVRGTGDTALVFVHCWACERSFWRGQVDHFADRFRVVAIDLPGHGASGTERERRRHLRGAHGERTRADDPARSRPGG